MKRIHKILNIVGFSLILLGVSAQFVPQLIRNRQLRQIRETADAYMQEKYGFSAELESYELHFCEYYLRMHDQDKKFFLFLDENRRPLYDTYQYEEICTAFSDMIQETYPDLVSWDLNIYGPAIVHGGDTLSHWISLDKNTKFDGSNLEALLAGCSVKGTAYFAGTELSDCALFRKMTAWEPDFAFVSFDSAAHLKEYLHNSSIRYDSLVDDADYYAADVLYAPYITQVWCIGEHGIRSTKYPVREGDGFLYCCPEKPDTKWSVCDDAEQQDVHARSGTYQFDSGPDTWHTVYVYLPAGSVPDGTRIAWSADNPGGTLSGFREFIRCGEYQVFELSVGFRPQWFITDELPEEADAEASAAARTDAEF